MDDAGDLIHPTELEASVGWLLPGEEVWDRAAVERSKPPSPRRVLEDLIRPALERPPCVVEFSGGRDSSVVLAVATDLARREGLAPPVPHTRRFPNHPSTSEDAWQEAVIRHLRLSDWQVIEHPDGLDYLGDLAQRFLNRVGLPPFAGEFVVSESLLVAEGGSLLTGEGGDEIFGPRRATYLRGLLEHPGSVRHRWMAAGTAERMAPRSVRRTLARHRYMRDRRYKPWVRDEVYADYASRLARNDASEPLDWRRALDWYLQQRLIRVLDHNRRVLGAEYNVLYLEPLLDASFVRALGRAGGRLGFANREHAMSFVAGELLPKEVLHRGDKATFEGAYFTHVFRETARQWDGSGVDHALVDPDLLRAEWLSPSPHPGSAVLLQKAWLYARNSASALPQVQRSTSEEDAV